MTPLMRQSLKRLISRLTKKVEQAEKACEKRMKAKVAEIKKEAQAEIRKAEKKAGEKINLAKEEVKSIKDVGDLFVRDFGFGSVAVVSKYAEELAKFGKLSIADELMDAQKSVRSLCICRSKRVLCLQDIPVTVQMFTKSIKSRQTLKWLFRICVQS